jgi:hypothetical protein
MVISKQKAVARSDQVGACLVENHQLAGEVFYLLSSLVLVKFAEFLRSGLFEQLDVVIHLGLQGTGALDIGPVISELDCFNFVNGAA